MVDQIEKSHGYADSFRDGFGSAQLKGGMFMSENEKNVTELNEEELKDVAGGGGVVYEDGNSGGKGCPNCGFDRFLDTGYDPLTGRVGRTCGRCGTVIVNGSNPFSQFK